MVSYSCLALSRLVRGVDGARADGCGFGSKLAIRVGARK
jgi:hypothetical protein